jgi:hypothetical protein
VNKAYQFGVVFAPVFGYSQNSLQINTADWLVSEPLPGFIPVETDLKILYDDIDE